MGLIFYVSVACSLTGFVLSILGVFAGNTPGFMENYDVITLNTSALGRNYVPALVNALDTRAVLDKAGGAGDGANGSATAELRPRKLTLPAAEGVLAGLPADTAADDMASVLGISQFYSLHVLGACEGTYAPNATASSGTWRNVSVCSASLGAKQLNFSARIDHELSMQFTGPASLAALGASSSLLAALNRVPTLGLALTVFYIVGAAAAGLSLLLTGASLVTRSSYARKTVLFNLAAAAGAALALLVAALVATVAGGAAVDSINRLGRETIGMAAARGKSFANMTWAAFGLMTVAALYWARELQADVRAAAAAAAKKRAAAA
ncbi:Actin cortical patch SUR7/pH-response regulator PalI [Niveomyces insectorum RCEF 264]|uniref:Actin cortical patch SUR7/pH-response regulator PalI n=1 Tax=Niveomyces insectorum RCEF 264 TaxID=1081102 RepID=A0A167Y1J4_9HYPO|nr:Actin cortical patch SUR7/pH-response regulator PalI [Niveomyces insectorum RCEF 264]